jgi:hypothetical protein
VKIFPVGAVFLGDGQAGRQAGMRKLIVDFRNFANTPKNPNTKTIANGNSVAELGSMDVEYLRDSYSRVVKNLKFTR